MPIYEYRCQSCGNEFELMRPFAEAGELAICPQCGGRGEKLISTFASKVDYYIKAPRKPAFRKSPTEGAG